MNTAENKSGTVELTLEQRVAALEAKFETEAIKDVVIPIVADTMQRFAGTVVQIGIKQIVAEMGKTIASPFTWVGSKCAEFFRKPATAPVSEPAGEPAGAVGGA